MEVKKGKRAPLAPVGDMTDDEAQTVIRLSEHLQAKAEAGVPYGACNLIDELTAQEDGLPMRLAAAALKRLQTKHGWREFWGSFTKGEDDVSLRSILDGSIARGHPYSTDQIAEWVELLTGEQVKKDTLARTLNRLVQQKRFRRVSDGVYERTFRGV